MARKKRGKQKEEEAGEAWLLPYSDLMTLLLALFISLFAISQTDQKKVSDLAQAFSSAFNMGGPSMFDKMGPNPGRRAEMPSDEDLGNSAYIQENQSLEQAKREMDEYIDQNQLTDQLSTELTEDGSSRQGQRNSAARHRTSGPSLRGFSPPSQSVSSSPDIRTMCRFTARSSLRTGS